MKKIIMCALGCALYGAVCAQGIVVAGAHITTRGMVTMAIEGSVLVTHHDSGVVAPAQGVLHMVVTGNWQNDHGAGVFDHSHGTSVVTMRGQTAIITGAESTQFGTVIADGSGTLLLGCDIAIRDSLVLVTSGVDLMGKTITLLDSATLVGENETVFVGETNGILGGSLWTTGVVTFGQPCSIGNLGLSVVGDQNTLVTLVRRHTPIVCGGGITSIARSYSVYTQDTPFVASAIFSYLPHELGGIAPDSLVAYASLDNPVWYNPQSFHDAMGATVSVTSTAFKNLTLAHGLLSPLSYEPVLVQYACQSASHHRVISWTVPHSNQYALFMVEKSNNLVDWVLVGLVPKNDTGSSMVYSIIDTVDYATPSYYRIMHVDYNGVAVLLDGYTIHSVCDALPASVMVYPNPNTGISTIAFTSSESFVEISISLFDALGVQVYTANYTGTGGYQTVPMYLDVPPGVYYVHYRDQTHTQVIPMVIY